MSGGEGLCLPWVVEHLSSAVSVLSVEQSKNLNEMMLEAASFCVLSGKAGLRPKIPPADVVKGEP